MGMKYYKLFDMMRRKNIARKDLLTVITAPTYLRLKNNKDVTMSVIGRLCDYLKCQPGDIMEYEPEGSVYGTERETGNKEM